MQTTATKNNRFDRTSQKAQSSVMAYYFYLGGVTLSSACAAVLISACAQAQPAVPTAPKQAAASAAMPAAPEAMPADTAAAAAPASAAPALVPQAVAKPSPKYSAKDIERAFSFMDANKDGKVSRAEAAGFRNVAKHFDAADSNKDNFLSLEEFGNALNRP